MAMFSKFDLTAYLKEKLIEPIDAYIDIHEHIMDDEGKTKIEDILWNTLPFTNDPKYLNHENMFDYAYRKTERETYQAMEALIHNLCTLASRSGGQVPFSSCNFGTDISEEGRMVSKNFMNAIDAGLGAGETAIFPIAIFKILKGVTTKGCKNYDLYQQSIRVSAKRGFPNWVNVSAPMNIQYYKKGHPETEVATMGCAEGHELIVWKLNGALRVTNFENMWNECSKFLYTDTSNKDYELLHPCNNNISIYDSHSSDFVNVKTIIKNKASSNFREVTFSNGRCITVTGDHPLPVEGRGRTAVDDLEIGDRIRTVNLYCLPEQMSLSVYIKDPTSCRATAWMIGMTICDAAFNQSEVVYSLGYDEPELVEAVKNLVVCISSNDNPNIRVTLQERGIKGTYYDVACGIGAAGVRSLIDMFQGKQKIDRSIPNWVFSAPRDVKLACIAGMIDADGYINNNITSDTVQLGSTNKTLALQQALLAEVCGYPARVYRNHYSDDKTKIRYRVEFGIDDELGSYLICRKKKEHCRNRYRFMKLSPFVTVTSIVKIDGTYPSYDVETESDRFDLSMIYSHNCRTRVIDNTYDPKHRQVTGRGNLFFTTINLPYLALEVKENNPDATTEELYAAFNKALDTRVDDCIAFSKERFKLACRRKAKNFPFAMGQHLYIGSENLTPDDSIEQAIKEGSQSVGFCGLAECLVALFGKHHGESKESQEKGLAIVKRMHDRIADYAKKENVNYSLFATPAEGCAGRLLRACRKRFGIIKGVTDREYITNSCHVPVYYKISAYDKIKIEAPYHPLCSAGVISYIELDYDATKNTEAMEKLVDAMADSGMTYFSINHPIDHDPVCGYVGHIPLGGVCPRCGRHEGEGVPAGKLLELHTYRPTPEYAVDKDMLEDNDTTTNDI